MTIMARFRTVAAYSFIFLLTLSVASVFTTVLTTNQVSAIDTVLSANIQDAADLPGRNWVAGELYDLTPLSAKVTKDKSMDIQVGASSYTSDTNCLAGPCITNTTTVNYTIANSIKLDYTGSNNLYRASNISVAQCTYTFEATFDPANNNVKFGGPQSSGGGIQCINASVITGKTLVGTVETATVSAITDEQLNDPNTYSQSLDCSTIVNTAAKAKCEAVKECHFTAGKATQDCISGYNKCVTDPANADMVSFCAAATKQGDFNAVYSNTNNPEPICRGALSWILCPLTTLVDTAIHALAGSIDEFMRFKPLLGSTQGDAILKIWQLVVGVANLVLVVAFLVVIFSQSTSVGLSAYGIKKMLPRIILAAILINISFYVCAVAVDISNVLGASMQGIINSASNLIDGGKASVTTPNFATSLTAILALLIAPTVLAAATGTIAFIVPVIVSGAVSLFFLYLVLALRHVFAVLLIIISPLAFAAMVLPNTESLFKKWWKAFYISLALYPIIMALAYGSLMVSRIILATAPENPEEALIWEVFAFIVLFAWIFALKFIVTLGGGIAGRLTGMMNDKNKGLIDRSKNWAKEKKDRSTYQTMKNMRKNAGNTAAQRRAIQRYSQGGVSGLTARWGGRGVVGGVTGGRVMSPYAKQGDDLLGTQAEKALAGIQKEQREVMMEHMNRPTMDIIGKGFRLNSDNKTFTHVASGQKFTKDQLTDDKHMAAAGVKDIRGNLISKGVVKPEALDAATMGNLGYIRDNKVMESTNGLKTATEMAFKTGAMDSAMLHELGSKVSKEDKAEFVEFANATAHANGYSHLGFTSTADNGSLVIGGRLGGMDTVAEKMLKSFGSVSKDVYADKDNKQWAESVHKYITTMQSNTPEAFRTELAKMDAQQADKFLKIMNAHADRVTPGAKWMDEATFNSERDSARRDYSKA